MPALKSFVWTQTRKPRCSVIALTPAGIVDSIWKVCFGFRNHGTGAARGNERSERTQPEYSKQLLRITAALPARLNHFAFLFFGGSFSLLEYRAQYQR